MKEKELRDEFAMAALGPLISHYIYRIIEVDPEYLQIVIKDAYQIADACMAEREKKE